MPLTRRQFVSTAAGLVAALPAVKSVLAADPKAPAPLPPNVPRELSLEMRLVDGAKWTLAPGGLGRPCQIDLFVWNKIQEVVSIWDPTNSEGSQCPGVLLTNADGKSFEFRPKAIPRLAGVPSVWAIDVNGARVISFDLLRLVGEKGLPPGTYKIRGFYENKLANDKVFFPEKVWTGRIESESTALDIVAPAAK
jgi:hypothetical protein